MAEIRADAFNWFGIVHHVEWRRPANLKFGTASNFFLIFGYPQYWQHPIHLSCSNQLNLSQDIHINNPHVSVVDTLQFTQVLAKGHHDFSVGNTLSFHQLARTVKWEKAEDFIEYTQTVEMVRGLKNSLDFIQTVVVVHNARASARDVLRFRQGARVYKENNPDFVQVLDDTVHEASNVIAFIDSATFTL